MEISYDISSSLQHKKVFQSAESTRYHSVVPEKIYIS
jgi:hypothetical protein